MRWENTACTLQRRYFLLDLELCARPGKPIFSSLQTWPDKILQEDGAYTEASDTLTLRSMLLDLNIVGSPQGHAFLKRMQPAAPGQAVPTVEVLLSDDWVSCIGDACVSAEGQPADKLGM